MKRMKYLDTLDIDPRGESPHRSEKSKDRISITIDNIHPLNQISLCKGKSSETPQFQTFDDDFFQVAKVFTAHTRLQVEIPELQFMSEDIKE